MLDKKSLGTSGGSLIHVAWNEHGPPAARAFIGVWQRVVNYWIVNRGYSIGIGDTIADAKTMDDIVQTIDSSKKEVRALTLTLTLTLTRTRTRTRTLTLILTLTLTLTPTPTPAPTR